MRPKLRLSLSLLLVLAVIPWLGDSPPSAGEASNAGRPSMQITVTQAKTLDFIEFLTTDGAIAARNYALVSPRVNGIIDEILVREGDQVKAGVTILFQIDNKKLRQSVELQSQALVIARS
ncbi:MAG: biotin/lipoyl-binding protein, partial [Planctomycetota bacterium]|nr:biotin/lipoyl-binding protein [Planctomycetota bacterium]